MLQEFCRIAGTSAGIDQSAEPLASIFGVKNDDPTFFFARLNSHVTAEFYSSWHRLKRCRQPRSSCDRLASSTEPPSGRKKPQPVGSAAVLLAIHNDQSFRTAMLAVTGRNRRCSLLLFDCATLLEMVANNLRRGHRRVVYICEAGKLPVQAFPFTVQRVAHAL